MKKVALLALAAMVLFSCNKDEVPTTPVDTDTSILNLRINVKTDSPLSRAVEDEHAGPEVVPNIINVTLIAYNDYGSEISTISLTPEQITAALYGDFVYTSGNNASTTVATSTVRPDKGAIVALPLGTAKVDVVINQSNKSELYTNINFFNYNGYGEKNCSSIGTTNLDRVPLTTGFEGRGQELGEAKTDTDIPVYTMDFIVTPSFARIEAIGGINVALPENWKDKFKNEWYKVSLEEFKKGFQDINTGTFNANGTYSLELDIDGTKLITSYGIVKGTGTGTDGNGFPEDIVYFAKYYWQLEGSSISDPSGNLEDGSTTPYNSLADLVKDTGVKAGWVKQETALMDIASQTTVQWLPHAYYAIDIEEIFINNIRVANSASKPSAHAWPGDQSVAGWPNWYNAYHLHGWHTAGASTANTFMCMGNMWGRIADSDTKKEDVTIPAIDDEKGSHTKMDILTGKAKPTGKSTFIDDANKRNLSIMTGKAAAYSIYPQSTTKTKKEEIAQEMPHIILKVKAYKTADDYAAGIYVKGKEFITIRNFKKGLARLTNIEKAYIYKFDLKELLSAFVGGAPVPGGTLPVDVVPKDPIDPDPEMPQAQVEMTVKVIPWKVENITPEI